MKLTLSTLVVSATVCLLGALPAAADNTATVTPLMKKELPNYPGKEGLMISVDYGPGGSTPIHKHEANAFVYVLEGSIVMQLKGEKEVTLSPGETNKVARSARFARANATITPGSMETRVPLVRPANGPAQFP